MGKLRAQHEATQSRLEDGKARQRSGKRADDDVAPDWWLEEMEL